MRSGLIAILLIVVLSLSAQVSIMTYNIRYNNPADSANAWPNRKERVAETIVSGKADIVGLQEVLKDQKKDLEKLLEGYGSIGVGRDNGKKNGEHCLIMFREEKFEVLRSGTFWLSKTPDVPGSKDWDAAITRICTWAQFKDKETGREFYVFNTHFDHKGEQARYESSKLLHSKIREIAGTDAPIVVTGDFNFDNASQEYFALTLAQEPPRLTDAYSTGYEGPDFTTAPNFTLNPEAGRKIDYIFYTEQVILLSTEIIDNKVETLYPSDHLPVKVSVSFY